MIPILKLRMEGFVDPALQPQMKSTIDAEAMFRSTWEDINRVESFRVMLLSSNLHVIGILDVSVGTITSCLCDIRIILQAALLSNATKIIVAHNHPSGLIKPSHEDEITTKEIKKACKTIKVELMDSLILSPVPNQFTSII